ncbi:gliding motility-associated C-terminal domain-containing protein [Polluticaenibacter yanchengensis]|uniref:Gliding motility-associated C-terminal domain-containing protein n=1 Tax=Polluticaenibacter yanchengensis TaxID=3014562 RepID=A0ABT4UMV8_9BACT|nr:gliding motility-associated C-terminal domain-containing protein [Chitinophagaceae bacterium LY-5]
MNRFYTTLVFLMIGFWGWSQSCPVSSLGQNPSTAFPVCGTSVFTQASVNLCGGRLVPNPKCNPTLLEDVNPYWYRFTCFETGTLGFLIQPNSNQSDYDWQVYDITGRDPEGVFTNPSWVIAGNWCQDPGETGTSAAGRNVIECEGPTYKYSAMPTIEKGKTYLLLVSHFTNTQAGYKLNFGGGTASITDETVADFSNSKAFCQGRIIHLKLNKPILCNSIAANGSDFSINTTAATILSASAIGCSGSFTTDSVSIILSNEIPNGNYNVSVKTGSDGNTLLDICNTQMTAGKSISVDVFNKQASRIASLPASVCEPMYINVSLSEPVKCNSIAADGSDFYINGSEPISINKAEAIECADNFTSVVRVYFNKAIQVGGTYKVGIKTGSDGNTLFNMCDYESVVGQELNYIAIDTVNASITDNSISSCLTDTLRINNKGGNGINAWHWYENNTLVSNTERFEKVYTGGSVNISLLVSNGICTDSISYLFDFDVNRVKAAFDGPAFACPLDTSYFKSTSTGPVVNYKWDFGNGNTSVLAEPPYQFYPISDQLQHINVSLVVEDARSCADTIVKVIQVPNNCYIAVPTAFTPNGDGLNDFLYPLNAYKATNLNFSVYNRFGQKIWETTDWTRKWDGKVNGKLQAAGTYVWYLIYTDDKGAVIKLNGTASLIR